MVDIDVKLSGDVEVSLEKFAAKIRQQVILSGAAGMAKVIYDEVLINAVRGGPQAPDKQSGDLEKSVYRAYAPDRSTDERKVYIVAARNRDAFYWRFLEFGTSKMAAQPFLRPALSRMGEAIKAGNVRMKARLRDLS